MDINFAEPSSKNYLSSSHSLSISNLSILYQVKLAYAHVYPNIFVTNIFVTDQHTGITCASYNVDFREDVLTVIDFARASSFVTSITPQARQKPDKLESY